MTIKDEALGLLKAMENDFDDKIVIKSVIRRLVEELDKQKYQNELLENSIKFAMLANNLQDKQGEPVVYWDGKHFASKEKSNLADIPLYTTPQTKPLSDEEITFLWHKSMGLAMSDDNLKNNISHASIFARAIEKAHGIQNSVE